MSPPKPDLPKWVLRRPYLAGIAVFLVLLSGGAYLTYQRYLLLKNEEGRVALNVAESAKARLQQGLQFSLLATQSLALTLNNGNIPAEIDSIAASILAANKYIDALQLVPDGIIRYTYPAKGNEAVLNYNIFTDPNINREAYRAVQQRVLFFAGPFELRQGGMAVVGRLPVFIGDKFWGFSAVIIRMSTLIDAAGIDTTGKSGYYYQLSKVNPNTGIEEEFLPKRTLSNTQFEVTVPVPDGEWKLSVIPINRFQTINRILLVAGLSLLLSVTGGLFTNYAIRKPAQLQQLVMEQTAELDKSEKRNKAIIDALPDLLFVIDKENRFVDYHKPSGYDSAVRQKDLIGKRVEDVLPPALSDEIFARKKITLESGKLQTYSYQLATAEGMRDFEARFVRQGREEVLLLVRDQTEIKVSEQLVKESEKKYRTLVEQATDGIFIADFKGRFIVVNPAGEQLSQYTQEELASRTIYDFALAGDLETMPFKLEELAAGKTASSERRMRRKDGSLIDVEITARIIGPDRFLAFIRNITERKRVEKELLQSREELRELSNHLEDVREEERVHIAREIHDELGQQLTILKMDVAQLSKNSTQEKQEVDVSHILEMINTIINTVRKISSELRPSMLDELGLISALDWYSRDFENRTGIKIYFITDLTDHQLPDKLKTGLFRIFQESLTNVARHAEATSVDVSLYVDHQNLVLVIRDNGKGFETGFTEGKRTLGLLGMRERCLMLKGQFNMNSTPGNGTSIEVITPLG